MKSFINFLESQNGSGFKKLWRSSSSDLPDMGLNYTDIYILTKCFMQKTVGLVV